MAEIIEEVEIKLERQDILARQPVERPRMPPARSPGVHLSGVLRYIASTIRLKGIWESVLEEEYPLRMAIGIMWEEFCASLYTAMVWPLGEVERDNVFVTGDGLSGASEVRQEVWTAWTQRGGMMPATILESCKATSKKRRCGQDFLREWLWMHQGKGECASWGLEFVRWHILYLQGDYNGLGPIYMRYLVHFGSGEITRTWNMVLKNKDRAVPE